VVAWLPAEEAASMDAHALRFQTPRFFEGCADVRIMDSKKEIVMENALCFRTLAYTANQGQGGPGSQSISVVDTVANAPFGPKPSVALPPDRIPLSAVLTKGEKPGRLLLQGNFDGTVDFLDASNFTLQTSLPLFANGYSPRYAAADIDTDRSGQFAYVANPQYCLDAQGAGPLAGAVTLIDIPGQSIVDMDYYPGTESPCAPNGISRLDVTPLYPVSLRVVGLDKTIEQFVDGEKYPGEYLFISGTYNPVAMAPCQPGQPCAPLVFPPTKMGVMVYDINPWRLFHRPGGEHELAGNPEYRQRMAFLGDGDNPEQQIFSIQGLDFAIHQSGTPGSATVYILNPNPNPGYAYMADYIVDAMGTATFTLKTTPDENLATIPTGGSPTDVKVQKVGAFTYAYITNANDDTVTVVDTATNIPSATPIDLNYCYPTDNNYPTSFDTRNIGDFGYASNFMSNTVSVIYLPTSSCFSPPDSDDAIHVGQAPVRIVVQPVPNNPEVFGVAKSKLVFASPASFTTPSKQPILVRDWERVHDLQETSADPQAVISNINNYQAKVNDWVVDEVLKESLNEMINLYRAAYIHDHPGN
jgi:DNA-binding beta-propeller fold protein YncE